MLATLEFRYNPEAIQDRHYLGKTKVSTLNLNFKADICHQNITIFHMIITAKIFHTQLDFKQ